MGRHSFSNKGRGLSSYLHYRHLGELYLQQVLAGTQPINARHPVIGGGMRPLDLVLLSATDADPRALHRLDRLLALGADPHLCDAWCVLLESPAANGYDALPYVSRLLAAGVHPDLRGRKGRTALHLMFNSSHRNARQLLERLLAAGADVNARDIAGRTPLRFYLKKHSPKDGAILAMLLRAGASPGARDANGLTPLHTFFESSIGYASPLDERESAEWTKALLRAGGDPLQRCRRQLTPLQLAARARQPEALAVMLDHARVQLHAQDGEQGSALSDALAAAVGEAVAGLLALSEQWGRYCAAQPGAVAKRSLQWQHLVRSVQVADRLVADGADVPAVTLTLEQRERLQAAGGSLAAVPDSGQLLSLVLQRPTWSPARHATYPPAFRAAAAAVLLTAQRQARRLQAACCGAGRAPGAHVSDECGAAMGLLPEDVLLKVIGDAAYPVSSWL